MAAPTTGDADRVANDLRAYLGPDAVDTFPAWETLPFERVSPSVETMGRRLRTMWRLRDPERAPRVLVAPVRALVQRLGPARRGRRAGRRRAGRAARPRRAGRRAGRRRLPPRGGRSSTAASWPCAGSIIDVFPSTADRPVRIDLWGDEVDRLTEFSVSDQRSTDDLDARRDLRLPRAAAHRRGAGPGRAARSPSSRGAASSGSGWPQGQTFDGMESWLPWLTEGEHVLFDLVGPDALVLLLEPRRMRDRAADLLAEEADLAASLAKTWGAIGADGDEGFPRLHLPFDRLLAHTDAPAWTVTTAPEGPDVATVASMGIAAAAGDPERVVRQLAELAARRLPHRRGRRRRGLGRPAPRRCSRSHGVVARRSTSRRSSGAASCPPSSWRCSPSTTSPVAAAPTARPAGRAATPRASSTTSRPATTSCTTSTASPATPAW